MLRRRKIDPLGRQVVLAIAAGRVAIGLGAVFATQPALRTLGFADRDAGRIALARLAGGRDIALGLLTLAARDDREALRRLALLSSTLDLGDAIAFSAAARDPSAREAAVRGVLSGSSAALAGLWAARRL